MKKFIAIFILVVGLIASIIEIYSFVEEEYPWILQPYDNVSPTKKVTQNHVDSQADNKGELSSAQRSDSLEQWKRLQAKEKHQIDRNEPTCQDDEECQSSGKDNLPVPSPLLDPNRQIDIDNWKRGIQGAEKHKEYDEYE